MIIFQRLKCKCRSLFFSVQLIRQDDVLSFFIKRLTEYYEKQLKKYEIQIIYEEVTPEDIQKGGYDAAVVAIGGKTRLLQHEGYVVSLL